MREAFVGVADAVAPAVRIVIENHVATADPLGIEGNGILPVLAVDPALAPLVVAGVVRSCCVTDAGENELLANMIARDHGITGDATERTRAHARANAAFGNWLASESGRLGIPVVPSRPFETLPDRILAAVCGKQRSPS